jgi:beta-phosphoglucomutase
MDGTLVDTNLANFSAYKNAVDSVLQTETNLVYNPEIRFNRLSSLSIYSSKLNFS